MECTPSELLLKGIQGNEQCFGTLRIMQDGKLIATCAAGAVIEGAEKEGCEYDDILSSIVFKDRLDYPINLGRVLIYMNDDRHFTREYCASVLKSLGY